jgi:hypothetical protein
MAKQDASKEYGSSLERAQYEYRKTIYFAGLKILETFSEAVIGRDPSDGGESSSKESGGGAGAHAPAPPPGPPAGGHIFGPSGTPPGGQAYGPPPGGHIFVPYTPPPFGCGLHADGPPPGGHINAIIKLVEVVLSLKPAAK